MKTFDNIVILTFIIHCYEDFVSRRGKMFRKELIDYCGLFLLRSLAILLSRTSF